MKVNEQEVLETIQKADPNATGDLTMVPNGVHGFSLTGEIQTSFSNADELSEATSYSIEAASLEGLIFVRPELKVQNSLKAKGRRVSISDNGDPGAVKYSTVGSVMLSMIPEGESLKRKNPEAVAKLEAIVAKTGFMAPVILNGSFEIIDGYLRVEVARSQKWESIPAIIIEADETLSTFLRLVFNRSSEFQRWDFTKVDEFADKNLNLTGYLEPFGIFGRNIVPRTFLGETVKNYEISEYNDQQKFYTQSIGLAEWARRVRKDDAEKVEENAKKKPKKTTTKNTTSAAPLFGDLGGRKPDVDPMGTAQKMREDQREEAGVITKKYDRFRGEKAAEQSVRRSSKKKTLDNRLAAESTDVDSESPEEVEELD